MLNSFKSVLLLLECLRVVVLVEQVLRGEQLHETTIDVILHSPDPLPCKGNAELSAHGFTVSGHQQGQETCLRDIFVHRSTLDVADQVLGNDRALSDCIDTSLGREGTVRHLRVHCVGVGLHCYAITTCKDIAVRS